MQNNAQICECHCFSINGSDYSRGSTNASVTVNLNVKVEWK